MCRWLVYVGDDNALLADLVTNPRNSIVQQSFSNPYLPFIPEVHKQRLNHRINGDGFGVGWYSNETDIPCVFTSIKPSWNDRNLHRLAETIWSRCIFAHVRAASPNSLIVENNCHPFQFGKILFMHNGCIFNFPKIKKHLIMELNDQCFQSIQGSTDSEYAAALFIQNLPQHDPLAPHSGVVVKEALLKSMKQIIRLTKESSEKPEPSSLNFAVTNGEFVIATRFRNSRTEEPPSLYYTKKPRYECTESKKYCKKSTQERFHSVVIASEPLSYNEDEWALVPKNHFVIITKSHRVLLEPIEFDEDLIFESAAAPEAEIVEPVRKSLEDHLGNDFHCGVSPIIAEKDLKPFKTPTILSSSTGGLFQFLTPPPSPRAHKFSPKDISANDGTRSIVERIPPLLLNNACCETAIAANTVRKGPDGNEIVATEESKEILPTARYNEKPFLQISSEPQVISIRLAIDVQKDRALLLLSLLVVLLSVVVFTSACVKVN